MTDTAATYKVRVGDDGTWVTCTSWLDAMRRVGELVKRAGMAQVLALHANGGRGQRTYHLDGRITQTGSMM